MIPVALFKVEEKSIALATVLEFTFQPIIYLIRIQLNSFPKQDPYWIALPQCSPVILTIILLFRVIPVVFLDPDGSSDSPKHVHKRLLPIFGVQELIILKEQE